MKNIRPYVWLALLSLTSTARAENPLSEDALVKKYGSFFSPRPGEEVSISEREKTRPAQDYLKMQGFITVTPKNKACIRLRRNADHPDQTICKKMDLAFTAGDINEAGQVVFELLPKETLTPIPLKWPTSHRVARVVPALKKLDTISWPLVIDRCVPSADARGEFIHMHMLDKRVFTFQIPKEHVAVPVGKETNLVVGADAKKAAPPPKSEHEGGEAKGEGEHGEAKPTPPPAPKEPEDKIPWAIPARHSYFTSGDHFMTAKGASGKNGHCRYRFIGIDTGFDTPWLECHQVGDYEAFIAPLPCLKQFQPRS